MEGDFAVIGIVKNYKIFDSVLVISAFQASEIKQ